MSGRLIEINEEVYVRTIVTMDVHDPGRNNEYRISNVEWIQLVESELGNVFHEVELGEVDMFEPEDYRDGEEPG